MSISISKMRNYFETVRLTAHFRFNTVLSGMEILMTVLTHIRIKPEIYQYPEEHHGRRRSISQ